MRIGIVTPFDSRNFGNRLQNFALQQTLKQYADDVITIKNKPAAFSLADRIKRRSFLAESVAVNSLLGEGRKVQLLRFNQRYLSISRSCYWCNKGVPALKRRDRCGWYCAGSDQIWNPNLGRAGMFNYLGFAECDVTFSYAASFGIDKIPKQYEEAVRKGLQHIKHISVREEAGKRIVEALTGRTDVQVLVDPTLLLTRKEWDGVLSKPKAGLPEKYLLMYFLGEVTQERRNTIYQKAETLGCRVVELMDRSSPFYEIDPGGFLYLIKHAAVICTDSFHGSVFSFLYQRPLAIFERAGEEQNMSSRLQTLVSRFQLEACLAKADVLPPVQPDPDYAAGYKVLEAERRRAKEFLDRVFAEGESCG